ncbi:permease prefix domain 1-containing protein [Sphaerisporangium fuscum]|uniref:permease prefix domain 1-containing protein n=1 Tax=Sphaerisporangium fuscum TaxID=2835868 RepID=UPI001BDCFDC9|nr:permease prefix domain 1-containing protein [Sphaerisporangium fuscum]
MSESAIDSYLADMRGSLSGPRRLKAELLQETRDSLDDAVEAFREVGYDQHEAESMALADFGTVAEVAPAYQRELALAQARRTARWFVVLMAAQMFLADESWQSTGAWSDRQPSALYLVFTRFWDYSQMLFVVVAVLALFTFGLGVRYVSAPWRFARITGMVTLVVLGLKALASFVLLAATPNLASGILSHVSLTSPKSLLTLVGLAIWVLPNWYVGISAIRCIAVSTARRLGTADLGRRRSALYP